MHVRTRDDSGVIYEVDLEVDAELIGPFDTWLRDHIADMLQLPGFLSAEILGDGEPTPGRQRRIVQYRLADQASLDAYMRDHAERMRAPAIERFGNRFTAQRRVLPHREEFIRGAVSTENCLNCGEVLTGQHCSHCGQRAKVRVLSLWSLMRDAFGDLTNFDSRLWRTLVPLAFRPGRLTQEFLRGRRVMFTPPFRMYLIISVVFFLLASIGDPGAGLELNVGEDGTNLQIVPGARIEVDPPKPPDAPAKPGVAATEATPAAAPPAASGPPAAGDQTAADRLARRIAEKVPEKERAETLKELQGELANVPDEQLKTVERIADDPCGDTSIRIDGARVLKQYEPRLRSACRKIMADKQSFGRALFDNIPKMMFIFLPLIAMIMAILYVGSGRYYVEHLLFFVHFHAFVFLAGIALLLLENVTDQATGGTKATLTIVTQAFEFVMFLYIPYYLYRAMRRVYGQGRFVTLLKYSVLGVAYAVSLVVTGIGLLFYTALTL